ncbi:MAG: hypothetical protein AAF217_08610 [Pseudomonadota bacterium]
MSVFSGFSQEVVPDSETGETVVEPILPPESENSVVETSQTLDRLFEKLRVDPNSNSAKATARQIWREWTQTDSDTVNLLMRWASRAMGEKKHAQASDLLDRVVVLAPDYAEGWNRRATVHYYRKDFSKSIADIEATLTLEPRHFGALSGLAAILQRIGQDEKALETWYKVLEIYPANQQAQESVIELEEELSGRRT